MRPPDDRAGKADEPGYPAAAPQVLDGVCIADPASPLSNIGRGEGND
jgi:hypothetical protein